MRRSDSIPFQTKGTFSTDMNLKLIYLYSCLYYALNSGSAFIQAVMKALDGRIDYSREVEGEMGNASYGMVTVKDLFKYIRTSMKTYFSNLNTLKRLEVEDKKTLATINMEAALKDDERDADNKKVAEEQEEAYEETKNVSVEDVKKKKKKKKKKKEEKMIEVAVYRELPPQDPILALPAGIVNSETALS